jgi:hypothetical protein
VRACSTHFISELVSYLYPIRNGGHIGPLVYNEYGELKSAHGPSTAEEILRFRLAHISSLISTAQAEGLLSASQAREVESFDVYGHPEKFAQAKKELHEFLEEAPADLTNGFGVVEGQQAMEVCVRFFLFSED